MNPLFWKGKKVFVTGHTGFKGSWLTLWLKELGAKVSGFSLEPNTTPNLFSLARVSDGIDSSFGDIRDFSGLMSTMRAAAPDVVLHLAAQPLVRRSYIDPVETYSTNVMGTVHLLESVRQLGKPCAVVIVTTDKCYENREWVWGYRENEAMGGYDPYSSSKGCAELVTSAFRRSFFNSAEFAKHGIAVASARAGNVLGGGDWSADRLIPDMVRSFQKGESVTIRNPGSTRPWQHVLEPLSAYLALAEKLASGDPKFADAFNFGPIEEDCWPVSRVVEKFSKAWGEGAGWEIDRSLQPHEAGFLKLDSSKAHALLGWSPRWRLERALNESAVWYRDVLMAGGDARETCVQQIRSYHSL